MRDIQKYAFINFWEETEINIALARGTLELDKGVVMYSQYILIRHNLISRALISLGIPGNNITKDLSGKI